MSTELLQNTCIAGFAWGVIVCILIAIVAMMFFQGDDKS